MTKVWWAEMPDGELVETAWEREMNLSGTKAFTEANYEKDASQTKSGQKALRKLLPKVSQAIREHQKELVKKRRTPLSLRATIVIIPAETAALLVLRTMFDKVYGSPEVSIGAPLQRAAISLSSAIETEMNFRNWIQDSKQAADEYAKAEGLTKVPVSYAERLIKEFGTDSRHIRRWEKAFEALNTYEWDDEEKHYCGAEIIKCVVRAIPEVFEIKIETKGGKQTNYVRFTEEFLKNFNEKEAQIANMQVVRKPMLTVPRRWEVVK